MGHRLLVVGLRSACVLDEVGEGSFALVESGNAVFICFEEICAPCVELGRVAVRGESHRHCPCRIGGYSRRCL